MFRDVIAYSDGSLFSCLIGGNPSRKERSDRRTNFVGEKWKQSAVMFVSLFFLGGLHNINCYKSELLSVLNLRLEEDLRGKLR